MLHWICYGLNRNSQNWEKFPVARIVKMKNQDLAKLAHRGC